MVITSKTVQRHVEKKCVNVKMGYQVEDPIVMIILHYVTVVMMDSIYCQANA